MVIIMDKEKTNTPLYCTHCKSEFTVEDFGGEPFDTPLEVIVDYCTVERVKGELILLNKTEEMYNEFPESEGKMRPKLERDADPTDEEIKLWTKGNKSLEEFLFRTYFDLKRRKSYVEKFIKDETVDPIICPKCKNGIIIFKDGELRNYEPKLT